MAKVRMKVTAEEMAKAGEDRGDFVLPKPGFYVLTMAECNHGYSADKEGGEDTKRPRLECIYTITGVGREETDPKENYGKIWDYVAFTPTSGWKRAQFIKAFSLAPDGATEFDDEFDTDDLINRKVLVRLKHEKGRTKDDPTRAKVATMFVYGSDPSDIEDGGQVVYSDEGEDAFGSDEPAEQSITEADLADMDLKALGEVYTEVTGNDPRGLVVKKNGKLDAEATKAAVIEAILAAQGDDQSVEEDDPF